MGKHTAPDLNPDIDLDEDQRVILGDTNPASPTYMDGLEFWVGIIFLSLILLAAMGALGGVAQALMSY